jgi:N-acetyl-anhydromuramyl-L-alanine amidase AmpD
VALSKVDPAVLKIEGQKVVGPDISFEQTPNHGGRLDTSHGLLLLIHYTAGWSYANALETLTKPENKRSATFLIGKAAETKQLGLLNQVTWHAGKDSSWMGHQHVNLFSHAIELDYPGWLVQDAAGHWCYPSQNADRTYSASHLVWTHTAVQAGHVPAGVKTRLDAKVGWPEFPAVQIARLQQLVSVLNTAYRYTTIIGHQHVTPRKLDPGPLFDWTWLRN